MEGKWTSDLTTILRSNKLQSIIVTCKGNDALFGNYKHTLACQFTQNPLTWKRGQKPFPYRLTFPLKFLPFDEKLCWNNSTPDFKKSAFLHIFFINSMSVEEYKSSTRHLVSEWFAQMTALTDVQWLIVVDSTKAKEKKNRSTLMDKIKSDFSKHQSKVIEVSESVEHGSFSSLVQSVQTSILQHLDVLVQSWENRIATKKDQYRDDNWNFVEYFHLVTDFARFFWSIGALEHALSIYDDLDRFISMITLEAAEDKTRESFWITKFRKSESPLCLTIRKTISTGLEISTASYLDVRHSLLCQQIILCLHMYYLRSRSKGAAPSIRVDFAALLLKYSQHCQMAVAEHSCLLGFAIPLTRLSCWTIFLVGDSLNICGLLSDPATITAAASSLCYLQKERFDSMISLEKHSDSGLIEWMEKSNIEDGMILVEALKDPSLFGTQLQKMHDTASTILVQSDRSRIAAFIGWQFAQWLSANGKSEQALPYKLRYLTRLLEDYFQSTLIVSMIKEVLPQLSEERDRERILSYLLFLSQNDPTNEDSLDQFVHIAESSQKKIALDNILLKGAVLLKMEVVSYPRIVHFPLKLIEIEISIENLFSRQLSFKECCLKLKGIDYTVLTKSTKPVYELVYSEMEQVARIVSPNFNRLKGSLSPEESPARPEIFMSINNGQLLPGVNTLTFVSDAIQKGCFIFYALEMTILDNITTTFNYFDVKNQTPIVFIGTNPHQVWVEEKTNYLAGLEQNIELCLEAGCNLEESEVFICSGGEEYVEFKNSSKEWKNEGRYSISPMGQGKQERLIIPIYVRMESHMTDSPAVKKVKFNIEWGGRSWNIELPFVALLILSTKTNQMETQNLLEVEIGRTMANEWTVLLESARLEIVADNGKSPPTLAKLLNPCLQDLAPNTVTNTVFLLPFDGEVPIKHSLFFEYRVKQLNDENKTISRLFSFKIDMEIQVRSVLYEICTQMLSQQPGAQLCRADSPCDLVVSLRSLKHTVELLYIVLDADPKLWTLNERAKVLQVKESGLGQIVFSVVPCTAGFLPYPSVSVYSCVTVGPRSLDGSFNEGSDIFPGSPLVSFHRTAGKQIRVLGASQNGQKSEEKKEGFKKKFVKLFD